MSNKAEQRKRREAKQAAARKRQQLNTWLIRLAVVIIVPAALFVFYQGLFTGAPVLPPNQVSENDHVRGAEDASALTVTVYADFQCPACLSEAEMIARAWPQIRDEVRLVFRHYPLDTHRFAFLAARYAEAAARQDAFWPMHDLLYATQQSWSSLDDAEETFDSYALQLGLNMDRLHADLDTDAVRQKIIADQQGGTRAGVRGTPAMFINGRLMPNPRTAGELIQMIRDAQDAG